MLHLLQITETCKQELASGPAIEIFENLRFIHSEITVSARRQGAEHPRIKTKLQTMSHA